MFIRRHLNNLKNPKEEEEEEDSDEDSLLHKRGSNQENVDVINEKGHSYQSFLRN